MIYGESVKAGFVERLSSLFPNIPIFKEKEDETDQFPNFFILQLNLNTEEDRKDHYFLTYFMTIRYRQAADINQVTKLQQKLDDVGTSMIVNLVDIPIDNKTFKLKSRYYEKIDGVVHFFANVTVQVAKEKMIYPKLNEMKLETKLVENS